MHNVSEAEGGTARDGATGERRGMAMVIALFAIVILATLVAGTLFSSTLEFRGGRNALVEQRAFSVAEYGLNSVIANWNRKNNLPAPLGLANGAVDSSNVFVAQSDTARVKITRLTDNTFLVVAEGRANIGANALESRRLTSAMVRIAYPSIAPKGAITAAGNVTIVGSAIVDGNNSRPAGWSQCDSIPGDSVSALVVAPGSTVSYNSNNIPTVSGLAPVVYDPAAADSNTYVRYGSESWNSLVANADINLPGGTLGSDILPALSGANCNYGLTTNWGEPWRTAGYVDACKFYFPIIYSASDLHLNGNGRGQGILLVNGDLEINGQFEFFGLIVVRDDLLKSNGTARIQGAVYAANLNLQDPKSFVSGNQDIFYSKCAIESTLRGSAILTRATERGWLQIY
jgi:hypothetical protein